MYRAVNGWLNDVNVLKRYGPKLFPKQAQIITINQLVHGLHEAWFCSLWPDISIVCPRDIVPKVLLRYNLPILSHICMFFLERIGFFFLATLPNKSCLSSLFLMVLSWAFTFNMLTEAWDVAPGVGWGVCNFTEHYLVWPWGEFTGIATPGTTVWTHIWMLQISKFPKLLFL